MMRTLFLLLTLFALRAAEPLDDIFAPNAPVLNIEIDIPREGIRSLQEDHRKYVSATVREGNKVYKNVAVHLKGAAGSFRDINSNPGLTLNFGKLDKSEPNQRFHGLRKIHLNNSVQDRSFSTHYICSRMFEDAGIPVARITHARVRLNGRDLRLYVLAEGYTKEFLARYFKETKGNLYDGGFLQEITENLENDAGEDRDRGDLNALVSACRQPDRTQRWEALEKVLDVDRFLTFMALEVLVWDWDGYPLKHNNYRIYHDPATDKMVFMPHGMDQMFWEANGPVFFPHFGGMVARAIMETPQGAKLYRERVKKVFNEVYRLDVVTSRFDTLAKRNRQAGAEYGGRWLDSYDANVSDTRRRIVARWNGIKEQIDNEPKPLDFSKPVVVGNWRQQKETENVLLEQSPFEGRSTLHLAGNGHSVGSWRSRLYLEPGRYRFEALARSSRLAPIREPDKQGAGIRVSGGSRRNKLEGDTGWTKLQYEFDVQGGPANVVLVCEIRATRGDVWFDANSLKLELLK